MHLVYYFVTAAVVPNENPAASQDMRGEPQPQAIAIGWPAHWAVSFGRTEYKGWTFALGRICLDAAPFVSV